MNIALTLLEANRERFALDAHGLGGSMSCLTVTPRFRTSAHVVFLVLDRSGRQPVLVVKTPRLRGLSSSIQREAANLRFVQAIRPGGFDSVPRVVACEPFCGHWMLVETALVGRAMDPAAVRRNLAGCCRSTLNWLADVQPSKDGTSEGQDQGQDQDRFDRLVWEPLRRLADTLDLSSSEARWLDHTWSLAAALRGTNLPCVLEHGDLSHPNLLILPRGGTGVVDWELAEPRGLPAQDLFFFLTYAAFAAGKVRTTGRHVRAFHAAFFGRSAWARQYVLAYARQLGLPLSVLTPLLAVCWARRLAGLLSRLDEATPERAAWLRANRYYALWRHTLTHVHELRWSDSAPSGMKGA